PHVLISPARRLKNLPPGTSAISVGFPPGPPPREESGGTGRGNGTGRWESDQNSRVRSHPGAPLSRRGPPDRVDAGKADEPLGRIGGTGPGEPGRPTRRRPSPAAGGTMKASATSLPVAAPSALGSVGPSGGLTPASPRARTVKSIGFSTTPA